MTARYEFIEEEKASFSVSSMCRALEVSSSGYCDWRSHANWPLLKCPRLAGFEVSTEAPPTDSLATSRPRRRTRSG